MTAAPLLAPLALEHPGALAGPPVDWAAVRRLLVVRCDNLGDVLMTGPALRALRAAAPRATLDLLASPGGAAAAALLPEVDGLVVHSPAWQLAGPAVDPDPAEQDALVARLAAEGYDAAVVLTSFSQSPWPAAGVLRAAGVPVRAGLSKEFGGTGLTHWVPSPPDDLHQVDRMLHLLARVGVAPDGTDLRVRVPEGAPRRGGDYAVVLPGASCSSRRWSPDRWAEVCRGLRAAGLHVVVTGPGTERDLVGGIAAASGAEPLAGALDLAGLAALLDGAAVALTGNSGGMHLADALRTPLVVLFAGTELEQQYAPRTTTAAVLRRPTPCTPCRAFDCPYAQQCLDVDPAEVVSAGLQLRRQVQVEV